MKGTVFCRDLHLPYERALAWSSFSRAPRKARTFHRRQTKNKRIQQIWMFPKIMGFPPNHPWINRVFHYKPSILGYPYFWKHPYITGGSEVWGCYVIPSNTPFGAGWEKNSIPMKTKLDSLVGRYPGYPPTMMNWKYDFLQPKKKRSWARVWGADLRTWIAIRLCKF